MITLVADVGGTQSRLGLIQNGVLNKKTIRKFLNSNFESFYKVIEQYFVDNEQKKISSCVIALAGPIVAGRVSFTNLDWEITVSDLKKSTSCKKVTLINDLTSLGYCLEKLPSHGITHITGPDTVSIHNGQYLVVGLGTGFNVCPVVSDGVGNPVCLQVELGHSSLPNNVKNSLDSEINAAGFNTVEDLFSGKGLGKLYQAMSGGEPKTGEAVAEEHLNGSNLIATQTLELFSKLLGLMTRELAVQYLPVGGIYFAGSVSRGIFEAGMSAEFEKSFIKKPHFLKSLDELPINLITDDAAGLLGCGVRSKIETL